MSLIEADWIRVFDTVGSCARWPSVRSNVPPSLIRSMSRQESVSKKYDALLDAFEPVAALDGASQMLGWDQNVMMPEGGTPARSKQMASISRARHDQLTDDRVGELLDDLEEHELEADRASVVREIRREYERADRVPRELMESIAETSSKAHPLWREARENDDFDTFAPILEQIVELRREYAAEIDPDEEPYAVLFADYEPYLDIDTADEVLTTLREELVPLIDEIQASDPDIETEAFTGTFEESAQEELVREALDVLGYDWHRGRLDTAPHPFSTGTQFDARVTTRFDDADLLHAVTSTIHEFGHAQYTLGLPQEAYGSPLGQSRNLSVHESQSRLWENHIGRSSEFWSFFLPRVSERFPELSSVTVAEAYESANQVYPDNPIRVDADELTYHLHIVIRYEIERALVADELDVEDVPTVWNDKYERYLDLRPDTDADGCLQDIHWSQGSIGYFPTYSLGSVMAAQLYDAMEADVPDVSKGIANGEFEPISEWLRTNVHQHGRRYTTPELVRQATGSAYTAEHFTGYVKDKYRDLYGI